MPSPSSSAKKRPSTKAKATTPTATEREPRGARRKRETRGRLLEAALRLMAKKGMEGVVINEITEAADVGFGSFYNHFESKEAIYGAVVDWVFEDFADALDRLVSDIADPAEVVSVSVGHTLLRAQREPVWGQFLIREGFSARVLERGLGQRLLRDIQRGIASGRFKREDSLMSFVSVGGTAGVHFGLASVPSGARHASQHDRPVGVQCRRPAAAGCQATAVDVGLDPFGSGENRVPPAARRRQAPGNVARSGSCRMSRSMRGAEGVRAAQGSPSICPSAICA